MCWSSHHSVRGEWSRDIRRRDATARADVRVSDAERNAVIEQLSRHTGDGRLTLDEFEERVERALAAKTRGDLDATLRGLPVEAPVRRRPRRDVNDALRPVAAVALIALAIVSLGAWVLWIVIPMAVCRFKSGHRRWSYDEPRRDSGRDVDDLTLV